MNHHEINLSSFAFFNDELVFQHSRRFCEQHSKLGIYTFNTEPWISIQNQFHKFDMNFCRSFLAISIGHPGIDCHSVRPCVVGSASPKETVYHIPVNHLARPQTVLGTSAAFEQWPQRYPGSLPECAEPLSGQYAPDYSAAFPQRSLVKSH